MIYSSFKTLSKTKAFRRLASSICAVLTLAAAPIASSQSGSNTLPDYSTYSAAQIETLIEKGDMHALFTKAFNLVFDAETNLLENPDFETALPLFQKAHDNGHDTANSFLTIYYYGDFGHKPNIEKADKIAIEAAENGSGIALLNYAMRYNESDDTEKSDRAFSYLKTASTDPSVNEHIYPEILKLLYGMFDDRRSDLPAARKWAKKCVKDLPQDAHCQYLLARDYGNGWGGDVDAAKSTKHFLKSAELGDARAQWTVGMKHLNGDGVEKNETTAFEWVKKSADQEHLNGLISYGVMNAVGQGTEINKAESFKSYEKAAKLGSGHAIRSIGAMYCEGEAPRTDKDLCAAGLILAYEMEDDLAANLLGKFFEIEDQAGFDSLKKKTAPSRATLISRYGLRF